MIIRPTGFAEAAAKRGMTEDEYWVWCVRKGKELNQWWDDLNTLGWKPTDTPTEFLKRINDNQHGHTSNLS